MFHVAGQTGDAIDLTGSGFGRDAAGVAVSLDGATCRVTSAADTTAQCILGEHSAGTYPLLVSVAGKGLAATDQQFEYELLVTSTSPSEGEPFGVC